MKIIHNNFKKINLFGYHLDLKNIAHYLYRLLMVMMCIEPWIILMSILMIALTGNLWNTIIQLHIMMYGLALCMGVGITVCRLFRRYILKPVYAKVIKIIENIITLK